MKGGKYNQWIDALVVVAFDIDEGIISLIQGKKLATQFQYSQLFKRKQYQC